MRDVHPTAIVEAGVELGADVEIGPYAVVRAGTVLGDGVTVGEVCGALSQVFGAYHEPVFL